MITCWQFGGLLFPPNKRPQSFKWLILFLVWLTGISNPPICHEVTSSTPIQWIVCNLQSKFSRWMEQWVSSISNPQAFHQSGGFVLATTRPCEQRVPAGPQSHLHCNAEPSLALWQLYPVGHETWVNIDVQVSKRFREDWYSDMRKLSQLFIFFNKNTFHPSFPSLNKDLSLPAVVDSWGKFADGLLVGNMKQLGFFHECLDINVQELNTTSSFRYSCVHEFGYTENWLEQICC